MSRYEIDMKRIEIDMKRILKIMIAELKQRKENEKFVLYLEYTKVENFKIIAN